MSAACECGDVSVVPTVRPRLSATDARPRARRSILPRVQAAVRGRGSVDLGPRTMPTPPERYAVNTPSVTALTFCMARSPPATTPRPHQRVSPARLRQPSIPTARGAGPGLAVCVALPDRRRDRRPGWDVTVWPNRDLREVTMHVPKPIHLLPSAASNLD
jgi:hypothetical protein